MSQLILLFLLHARLVSHLNHHRWNILISHSRLIFGARLIITPQPVGVVLNRRTDHVSPQLATQTSTTMAVKPHYLRLSAETRWQLYRRQPFNVKTTWQSLIDWLEWLHQSLYKQIFARYARLFFFCISSFGLLALRRAVPWVFLSNPNPPAACYAPPLPLYFHPLLHWSWVKRCTPQTQSYKKVR